MGSEVRRPDTDVTFREVEERLRSEPWTFGFFQAVRLLERMQPHRAPVGGFDQPGTEAARFRTNPSLSFPASEIQDLEWEEDRQPRMTVNFMGLVGPVGVLPYYYTELIADRNKARDHGVQDFLDIFHHRMLSLFYRAWLKHQITAGTEKAGGDVFYHSLLCLAGLGIAPLQRRQKVRDETMAFYAGLLSLRTRPAVALRGLLADYFGVPASIDCFVGAWRRLRESDQCELQDFATDATSLGQGSVVGDEVWDQQSRVRVRLGPLTAEQYRRFLPDGDAHRPLRELLRMFSDDFEYEVQLVLAREAVRPVLLGGEDELQLGWTTWMKSGAGFDRDPDETILLLT